MHQYDEDYCAECGEYVDDCRCLDYNRFNEDDERCELIRDDNRARLVNIKGY